MVRGKVTAVVANCGRAQSRSTVANQVMAAGSDDGLVDVDIHDMGKTTGGEAELARRVCRRRVRVHEIVDASG